jgi:hypothetical protein
MWEYSTLHVYRSDGQARWRAEVPVAGTETGLLVGWSVICAYLRSFGWHPKGFRPLRCHLTPQDVTFTAVQVVFAREVPAHPEAEGIAWHAATLPGGPYGS